MLALKVSTESLPTKLQLMLIYHRLQLIRSPSNPKALLSSPSKGNKTSLANPPHLPVQPLILHQPLRTSDYVITSGYHEMQPLTIPSSSQEPDTSPPANGSISISTTSSPNPGFPRINASRPELPTHSVQLLGRCSPQAYHSYIQSNPQYLFQAHTTLCF